MPELRQNEDTHNDDAVAQLSKQPHVAFLQTNIDIGCKGHFAEFITWTPKIFEVSSCGDGRGKFKVKEELRRF